MNTIEQKMLDVLALHDKVIATISKEKIESIVAEVNAMGVFTGDDEDLMPLCKPYRELDMLQFIEWLSKENERDKKKHEYEKEPQEVPFFC